MAKQVNNGRRRVPRRSFESPIGVLLHGEYKMERSYQVGEGGMMLSSRNKLELGTQVVISFFISSGSLIIVRGVVRSVAPATGKMAERFGIEFLNLGFQFKREIRNFVAAASSLSGQLGT
jgi:PilZ domain